MSKALSYPTNHRQAYHNNKYDLYQESNYMNLIPIVLCLIIHYFIISSVIDVEWSKF